MSSRKLVQVRTADDVRRARVCGYKRDEMVVAADVPRQLAAALVALIALPPPPPGALNVMSSRKLVHVRTADDVRRARVAGYAPDEMAVAPDAPRDRAADLQAALDAARAASRPAPPAGSPPAAAAPAPLPPPARVAPPADPRAQYEASAALQLEFDGVEDYLAFVAARDRGLVRK
jgi:hypothetical protein